MTQESHPGRPRTGKRTTARILRGARPTDSVPVLVGPCDGAAHKADPTRVRLIRGEGGESVLEIDCACGRTIRVDCRFE